MHSTFNSRRPCRVHLFSAKKQKLEAAAGTDFPTLDGLTLISVKECRWWIYNVWHKLLYPQTKTTVMIIHTVVTMSEMCS